MRSFRLCTDPGLLVLVFIVGCSSGSSGTTVGAGGSSGLVSGGATGTSEARGGSTGDGGARTAQGGASGANGGAATGGTAFGGALTGGSSAAGGAAGSVMASGGSYASGGRQGTGGMPGSGEVAASGGRTGTGGTTGTGGGSLGTGGAAGGAASVGGSSGTGGVVSTGSTNGSGGAGGSATCKAAIPAIDGACPPFATGTVTVGGLGGIALQVGPRSQGTGSLLFYWHGTGSSTAEVSTLIPSAVRQDILGGGGIIVAFQSSLGSGGDCSGTATFSKDDFKVADQIVACAVRDHDIDPCRIYTTGCSAGGLQSGCMAALRSGYLAAAVPNSGGVVMEQPIQDKGHIPAIMTMHGGSSDVVIVAFSTTSATLDKQMKSAGGFVVNCNHGGGHCQAPAALYAAGWEFMKAHPFGVSPEPFASGVPASFPSYCALY
jgi:hypothetical protein